MDADSLNRLDALHAKATPLLPCPFCGLRANHCRPGDDGVGCSNPHCYLFTSGNSVPIPLWNTRPIESSLRAALASAERENARLREVIRGTCKAHCHPKWLERGHHDADCLVFELKDVPAPGAKEKDET